jgi:uncharacterized protein YhbP (UPF0306 family)
MTPDLEAHARALLDANAYLTLASADAAGTPWASPVYFAYDAAARRLLWVSRPNTRHSRNIAERPEVSAVVFDSTVAVGEAEALYVCAWARALDGAQRESGIETFSSRSVAHRAGPWTLEDVMGGTELCLFGADITEAWVLDRGVDRRLAVTLG